MRAGNAVALLLGIKRLPAISAAVQTLCRVIARAFDSLRPRHSLVFFALYFDHLV